MIYRKCTLDNQNINDRRLRNPTPGSGVPPYKGSKYKARHYFFCCYHLICLDANMSCYNVLYYLCLHKGHMLDKLLLYAIVFYWIYMLHIQSASFIGPYHYIVNNYYTCMFSHFVFFYVELTR